MSHYSSFMTTIWKLRILIFFIIVRGLNVSWVTSGFNCHCLPAVPHTAERTHPSASAQRGCSNSLAFVLELPQVMMSGLSPIRETWTKPDWADPIQHRSKAYQLITDNEPHWSQTSLECYYTLIWNQFIRKGIHSTVLLPEKSICIFFLYSLQLFSTFVTGVFPLFRM